MRLLTIAVVALLLFAVVPAPASAAPSGLWAGTPYVSGSYVRASFEFWNDGVGRPYVVLLRYGGNWTTCISGWALPWSHVVGNCGVWTTASGPVTWRADLGVSSTWFDLSPNVSLNRLP